MALILGVGIIPQACDRILYILVHSATGIACGSTTFPLASPANFVALPVGADATEVHSDEAVELTCVTGDAASLAPTGLPAKNTISSPPARERAERFRVFVRILGSHHLLANHI